MIPLAVPDLTGNERKYLNQCIDTTFVSSVGEFVNRIEEMTAEKKWGRIWSCNLIGDDRTASGAYRQRSKKR